MNDDTSTPAPIVADTELCSKSVAEFFRSLTDPAWGARRNYRNVAHAYALLKAKVPEFAELAREAKRAEHEAAIEPVERLADPEE